jgi:outer membrane protein OmpA-like peptidoglycan-associated protein
MKIRIALPGDVLFEVNQNTAVQTKRRCLVASSQPHSKACFTRILWVVLFMNISAVVALAQAQSTEAKPVQLAGVFTGNVGRHSGEVHKHSGEVGKLTVQETPTKVKIELPGDVLFDFDKSELRADAEPTLRQTAEIIQRYPKAKVVIAGYTDAKGAETYNLQLSKQRAASVKAWLVQQGGIDSKRITTKGWGKAKPVAANTHPDGSDNPEGRQQNRRVELTVKK